MNFPLNLFLMQNQLVVEPLRLEMKDLQRSFLAFSRHLKLTASWNSSLEWCIISTWSWRVNVLFITDSESSRTDGVRCRTSSCAESSKVEFGNAIVFAGRKRLSMYIAYVYEKYQEISRGLKHRFNFLWNRLNPQFSKKKNVQVRRLFSFSSTKKRSYVIKQGDHTGERQIKHQ